MRAKRLQSRLSFEGDDEEEGEEGAGDEEGEEGMEEAREEREGSSSGDGEEREGSSESRASWGARGWRQGEDGGRGREGEADRVRVRGQRRSCCGRTRRWTPRFCRTSASRGVGGSRGRRLTGQGGVWDREREAEERKVKQQFIEEFEKEQEKKKGAAGAAAQGWLDRVTGVWGRGHSPGD